MSWVDPAYARGILGFSVTVLDIVIMFDKTTIVLLLLLLLLSCQ